MALLLSTLWAPQLLSGSCITINSRLSCRATPTRSDCLSVAPTLWHSIPSTAVTQLAAGLLPCTVTLRAISRIGPAKFHGFEGRYYYLGSHHHDFAAPPEPSQGTAPGPQRHLMLVCLKAACTACCGECRSRSRLWPFHVMGSFLPHLEVRMIMHW